MPAAEPAPMEGDAEEYEEAEVIDDDARQIEGDTLDPETGEVTSRAERGEGTVRAWWPEADEAVRTDVGPTTQYAELVVDYFHSGAALMHETVVDHWCVVGIGDGRTRELHAVIAPEDHGLEFAVVYGTAADLEPELRSCGNCDDSWAKGCAMVLPEDQRDTGTGCGGNGWHPVTTVEEAYNAGPHVEHAA